MKLYVRLWRKEERAFDLVATLNVDAYSGVTFREVGESATNVVMKGMRVTEMYVHASEPNALCVYVEEVQDETTR